MTTKTCIRCKQEKPFDEFYNNNRRKDGKQKHCKQCAREYAKAYHAEDFTPSKLEEDKIDREFGRFIRLTRESRSLSVYQAVARTDDGMGWKLHDNRWTALESGKCLTSVRPKECRAIARALKIDVAEVLKRAGGVM